MCIGDRDYVVPPSTIIIENPLAVVDTAVDKHGDRAAAEALVAWLHTAPAQAIFAAHGLPTSDPALTPAAIPTPTATSTFADLGPRTTAQECECGPARPSACRPSRA